MAVRGCFRRFRSFQLLFINTAYTRLKDPFLNVRTPFPTLTPRVLRPFTLTRTLCSDGRQNDEDPKVKTANLVITQGPIGWLLKTVNLWLLQKFIDHEFEEREFLRGAKQALCVISELVNRRSWEEMEGIMSEKLASDIQHNTDLIEKLGPVVTWQQIVSANIQKVQVGFVENGKGKLVDIQVAFMCANQNKDEFFEKQLGNVKIIGIPTPKIVYYTFRKFIFPDSVSDWHVDAISRQ